MIDYKVLKHFGTTQKRLKAVFSASPATPEHVTGDAVSGLDAYGRDAYNELPLENRPTEEEFAKTLHTARKRWEGRIQARITNGRELSMRNYRYYMSADMAIDNEPINPAKFAHMLYATGNVKLDNLYAEVKRLGGDQFCDELFIRDKQQPHNIIGLNTPKLTDFTVNLVRPYLRRSVAAQVVRYENLYPFLRYEARTQSLIGKLRADILSEVAEIMTDQFGYRHAIGQEIRGMFLHSHAMSFVVNSWAAHKQMVQIPDETTPAGFRMKERIEKEGVRFQLVHPTRIFYDTKYPLTSINYDYGCQFVGFWDLISYRDIRNNSGFFNCQSIPYSAGLHTFIRSNSAYFNYYYASTIKNALDRGATGAEANRRDANTHTYYSDTQEDECLWLTHYYEKVTPKNEGLGDYPHPVWVHLIVAGDTTVVFAEILPSRPGYCMAYDEDDQKLLNISMALDIMPYQEQVSNLFSQLLYLMQVQNLLILAVDSDVVPENIRVQLKEVVEGRKLFNKVHLIEFESQMEELFDKTLSQKKPIQVFQAKIENVIGELMRSISQIIALLERNQMMSPNEMGAFVERETSATEVQAVGSTTNDLHSYKSSGIDEARQAMKVILYESLVACGSPNLTVTVPERYPSEVIKAANFSVDPLEAGYTPSRKGVTLIGTVDRLVGEYVFSSRDGAERASNTESAKVLMELMRYMLSSEIVFKAFVDAFGMEQVTKALSEVFRMAGSPLTLKLPTAFSDQNFSDQNFSNEEAEQARREMESKLNELDQRLQQVEQVAEDYVAVQENQQPPQPPMQGQPVPQGPNGAPF